MLRGLHAARCMLAAAAGRPRCAQGGEGVGHGHGWHGACMSMRGMAGVGECAVRQWRRRDGWWHAPVPSVRARSAASGAAGGRKWGENVMMEGCRISRPYGTGRSLSEVHA